MNRRRASLALPPPRLLAALLLAGCGGTAPRPAPPAWCPDVPVDAGGPTGVLTVALLESIRPENVPSPINDSEALVFRHVYEGLTDVDCSGDPVPALAESWGSEDGGLTWTFRIREGALFTDGGPVSASGVLEAWRRSRRIARGDPARFALWRDVLLRDVTASGLTLTIRLAAADPDLPRLLATDEFAVYRSAPRGWPGGTRGRAIRDRYERDRTVWSVEDAAGEVRFVLMPKADPRDAMLPDVDLLVTRQRAALAHFAALADVRLTPLPWSRSYLVSATTAWPAGPPDDVRRELAEQVLRSTARPADSILLDPLDGTGAVARGPDATRIAASRSLVAPAPDADAVTLAERIASRWARDLGPVVVAPRHAEGVTQAAALGEAPVVLGLARGPAVAAHQRRRIEALAPGGAALPEPLVCTRATVVSRAEVTGLTWGYDGILRLDRLRRLNDVP